MPTAQRVERPTLTSVGKKNDPRQDTRTKVKGKPRHGKVPDVLRCLAKPEKDIQKIRKRIK